MAFPITSTVWLAAAKATTAAFGLSMRGSTGP
eukprot:CAMPEP_0173466030 /NCGR_PEP_ID=MMETSP1357-20121228/72591_1 /TAXON_ID=77926 /ORGANISM="Hemiselmis rufescens, Strain PCC563" /LENGTH=31 /DNA_ID= /DNA_START= /DNA_END= /DNA_ORIENTATION=